MPLRYLLSVPDGFQPPPSPILLLPATIAVSDRSYIRESVTFNEAREFVRNTVGFHCIWWDSWSDAVKRAAVVSRIDDPDLASLLSKIFRVKLRYTTTGPTKPQEGQIAISVGIPGAASGRIDPDWTVRYLLMEGYECSVIGKRPHA